MSNDGRPQMRDLVAERAKNDLITWSAWLCEYVKRVSAVMVAILCALFVADCYKSAFSWWNQPPDILSHECLSNLM
ncbi:unnamed protein product [Brassica oleracea]